jgi:hypothetical protein
LDRGGGERERIVGELSRGNRGGRGEEEAEGGV